MRKRNILVILGAIAAALLMGVYLLANNVMSTLSWGLHFPSPGVVPEAPASAAQLQKYDAAYIGKTGEKVLYLTFDAGYENGCTGQILDVLKKHDVQAAFFLVGNYISRNPDLVRRMVAEGHTVGNHTMHHPNMSLIHDEAAFEAELRGLEEEYMAVTGEALPKYYRPPQGVYSERNLQLAQKLGYKTVFWSLAYVDWKNDEQPDHGKAVHTVLNRTHDGAVVLLHSTSATNAAILDELLTRWAQMGYRFGTLEELFA